ncbi:MAG: hypothetical protein R3C14_43185 [Caldilineaceae bacterium]
MQWKSYVGGVVLASMVLLLGCQPIQAPTPQPAAEAAAQADAPAATSDDELIQHFRTAVVDAKDAEPAEIVDTLTALTPDNTNLVFEEGTGRLLMVTWTSWNGYDTLVGQDTKLQREVWVTAVPEVRTFCQNYQADATPRDLRLEELLGLPPHNGKTRFVEMWVPLDALFRPSPDPEVDDTTAGLELPDASAFASEQDYEFHRDWYNLQVSLSYDAQNGYPWTRLGYTYDWGNPESEVGLSEFVIYAGSTVGVAKVYGNDEYCAQ